MGRVANTDTETAWCEWCGNTGWVHLRGAVQVGRTVYERGVTACRWCDQGALRYAAAKAATGSRPGHRQWDPEGNYSEGDVDRAGRDDDWDRRHGIKVAGHRQAWTQKEAA